MPAKALAAPSDHGEILLVANMRIRLRSWVFGVVLVAGVLKTDAALVTAQQLPFNSGQNVVPVYEGWERNPDGSVSMIFGYFNRNYREELHVPIGPDNEIQPGGPDRGQPTFFYPRRQEFQFRVPVPKDWGTKDVIWTLTVRGKTEKAFGSLNAMYEVDKQLIAKNLGSASFGVDAANEDQPPSIKIAPPGVVVLPNTATLRATISDDGIPKAAPRRGGPGGGRSTVVTNVPAPPGPPRVPPGLSVMWIQYRGPGVVKFEPAGYQSVTNGGTAVATARFSEPGAYVLRAVASDSLLPSVQDVTVTVTGPKSH
jgi:hypothetical protein